MDGKLILEYSWDKLIKMEQIKTETADFIKTENENDKIENELDGEAPPSDLNLSLQRLLSVAKLHYRKNMIKCPCGHVCGGPPPSQKQKGGAKKNNDTGMCDKSTQSPEVSDVIVVVRLRLCDADDVDARVN